MNKRVSLQLKVLFIVKTEEQQRFFLCRRFCTLDQTFTCQLWLWAPSRQ